MPDTVVFLLLVLTVAVVLGVAAWLTRAVSLLATRRRECPHRPTLHHRDRRGRLRCEMCGLPAPAQR